RFDYFYDRPWRIDESKQTKLVVIVHELDAEKIQASFT
ncbi:MAG: GTP-binding protein, partial [Cyanobacteria bacterium J06632_3]